MPRPVQYTYDNDVEDNIPARPEPTRPGEVIDSDLTDMPNACAVPGYIDQTHFPAQPPGVADQRARVASRKASAPGGADATPQTLALSVPFSGTALTMGCGPSAGCAGAALTTGGNVFVGATGVLGMQAADNLTAQTNAAMGLYSDAGTQAHSQAKFEVYAGGGAAPGPCGTGGPGAPGPVTKPAEGAENLTNVACNAVGTAKAVNDIVGVVRGGKYGVSEVATLLKGGTDAVNKGVIGNLRVANPKSEGLKTTSAVLDTASAVFGLGSALTKPNNDGLAILSTAISSGSTVSGAFGLTAAVGSGGGGSGGGGGPTDIEERASGSIKMVCNMKISGNAPEGIDWKTATKFGVNAVALVDFATTNWGAFAAAKFEVKCPGVTELTCKKFEMKGYASGTLKAKATIDVTATTLAKLDGKVRVTKQFDVDKATTFKDTLQVRKDATFQQSMTVKMAGVVKGNTVVDKPCDFKQNLTVKGKATTMAELKVQSEAKLG